MDKQENELLGFHCTTCGKMFKSTKYDTVDNPDREWYPYNHHADCPVCDSKAGLANWQIGTWSMAVNHGGAGPSTEEGRWRISQANRNRDKSTYERSRFNAITHGATAQTAKFFPARPGGYPLCDGCEFMYQGCGTEFDYCYRRTELYVKYALAQETGDAGMLGKFMAENQAGLQAILSDMIIAIARTGVEVRSPKFVAGEKGARVAQYEDAQGNKVTVEEITAHPLLKPLIEFMDKNNMTLEDMSLTAKTKTEEEQLGGFLESKEKDRESLLEYQRNQNAQQKMLLEMIDRGKQRDFGDVIDGEIDH